MSDERLRRAAQALRQARMRIEELEAGRSEPIAIVSAACRFPGAGNYREFWTNLQKGVESIGFLSAKEVDEIAMDPEILSHPNFIPAKGRLAGSLNFDSFFFGYTPSEAEIMDPQIRVYHEVVWEALEDAGYEPDTYNGIMGLYAGATANP